MGGDLGVGAEVENQDRAGQLLHFGQGQIEALPEGDAQAQIGLLHEVDELFVSGLAKRTDAVRELRRGRELARIGKHAEAGLGMDSEDAARDRVQGFAVLVVAGLPAPEIEDARTTTSGPGAARVRALPGLGAVRAAEVVAAEVDGGELHLGAGVAAALCAFDEVADRRDELGFGQELASPRAQSLLHRELATVHAGSGHSATIERHDRNTPAPKHRDRTVIRPAAKQGDRVAGRCCGAEHLAARGFEPGAGGLVEIDVRTSVGRRRDAVRGNVREHGKIGALCDQGDLPACLLETRCQQQQHTIDSEAEQQALVADDQMHAGALWGTWPMTA